MKPSAPWPKSLSGLTPLPCLATTLVAAAFVPANLGDTAISPMSYHTYGFPLTYRRQDFRPPGVDELHPGALTFDIALATVAIASTFVATRRWSRLIGRYQRFTVRGLMATVAICAILLAVSMAVPSVALAMFLGALLFGFLCIVHAFVLITFHGRLGRERKAQGGRA
jgi:hypothetical protein